MSANIICSLCYKGYHSADQVVITTCGHIFHKNCLKKWNDDSDTCPQCPKACIGGRRIFPQYAETEDRSSENLTLNEELEKYQDRLLETEKIYSDLLERFQLLQNQSKRDQSLQKTYQQPEKANSTFSSVNSTIKSSTFSSVNSTIKSSKFYEAHWRSLIKTLESELKILSKHLNIEMNFTQQKSKVDLSERIMNLIKNVSFMVRVSEKKEKRSETQLYTYRESKKDQSQIDYSSWAKVLVDKR